METPPIVDRIIMTPEQFVSICKRDEKALVQTPQYFIEEEGPYKTMVPIIKIENVDVNENILLTDIEQSSISIRLVNVRLKNLTFENCHTGHINIVKGSVIRDLNLQGEKTYVKYLKLQESTAKYMNIYNGAQCDFLIVDKNQGNPSIFVDNEKTRLGYLKLIRANIAMLEAGKSNRFEELDIDQSRIVHVKLHENISLNNIQIKKSICLLLEFQSAIINDNLKIDDSHINYFWLQAKSMSEGNINKSVIQTLKFKTTTSTTLNLFDCQLIEFSLQHIKTGKDGLVQLINCSVNTLEFDTVLNLASINVKNLQPLKSLRIYKYRPLSVNVEESVIHDIYEMTDFVKGTQINIFNADLGKVMFSSNLSGFDKFYFSNSKIIEAFIAGPKLPDIYARRDEDEDEQRRIAYNQIKRIYENRGDNITAMKYNKLEMEIYRRQLRNGLEDKIPGEKFQLLFNQFTNRHGTEWLPPILLTLAISIVMYIIYCMLLFGFDINGTFKWQVIPYYFEFLNPTHKIDFIKKIDFVNNTPQDNIALTIDALCRIVVTLLLYQMIQAFRKYGKR